MKNVAGFLLRRVSPSRWTEGGYAAEHYVKPDPEPHGVCYEAVGVDARGFETECPYDEVRAGGDSVAARVGLDSPPSIAHATATTIAAPRRLEGSRTPQHDEVRVLQHGRSELAGVVHGIAADGALEVETPAGEIHRVVAGDVTLARPGAPKAPARRAERTEETRTP